MGRRGKGAAASRGGNADAEEQEPVYGRVFGDAHDEDDLVRTDVLDYQALREKDPGERNASSASSDEDDDDTMAVLGLDHYDEGDDEDEDDAAADDYDFGGRDEDDDGDAAAGDDEDDSDGRARVDLAMLREMGEDLLLPSNMDYINKMAGYNQHGDIVDRKNAEAKQEAFLNRWGSNKQVFYGTNYVDHDFKHNDEELQEAKDEEVEALRLQKQQAEAMDEGDFDALLPAAVKETGVAAQQQQQQQQGAHPLEALDDQPVTVERDLSQLTQKQRMKMLRKALPELARHTAFMQQQVVRLREVLEPLHQRIQKLSKAAELPQWAEYVVFQYKLATAYTTNVLYLIYAQAKGTLRQSHPSYTACSTLRTGLEATSSAAIDERLARVISGDEDAEEEPVPATAAEAMLAEEESAEEEEDEDEEGGQDLDEAALNKAALKLYKKAAKLAKDKKKRKQQNAVAACTLVLCACRACCCCAVSPAAIALAC
ncbi:hypothetical protein PTSG_03107 [Salpingoeca rosetta]|uniref:Sas10 C-terminal domain-containing protein n=1 Tax=Salpingoeca rosetta (strain ATCC 50818 / BSB-021) TaxID=946362 RepID=F2U491_SALR5|nr:uncharacterized protein PTSG_03107 [Salpingoeca rosetta]EGD82457.1 hypothetical protein PTSG_03107 [Salpingoeca rosetta]|eukprot:XP_004995693.1 hypothetical protein PTSG_03107 [Salpingoeca rosetta]